MVSFDCLLSRPQVVVQRRLIILLFFFFVVIIRGGTSFSLANLSVFNLRQTSSLHSTFRDFHRRHSNLSEGSHFSSNIYRLRPRSIRSRDSDLCVSLSRRASRHWSFFFLSTSMRDCCFDGDYQKSRVTVYYCQGK